MPVFSCGGMRYQHAWKDLSAADIPVDGQQNVEATIRRALELGIHHIETARGYGTSELQLGHILPRLPREQIIVQTKVSPKPDPQEFRETLERSLGLLQLDYIDLLGLHGINNREILEYAIRPGGCLEVAQSFQKQGRVRFIGFSTHAPRAIIQEAIATDAFDYVNLHWYYINQVNWPAIAAARDHDMGVFIISPSDKGGKLYQPSEKLVELCAPLSPIVFNDLFCLSHPEVHTLSVGASRPSDFDEHIKTLEFLDQADVILPNLLARLETAAIDSFARHFGSSELAQSWYKTWSTGLPNHEQTPENMNIPVMVWLWNLAIAFDMVEYGKMRYNLLGNASHWFPGNKYQKVPMDTLQHHLVRSPHSQWIPSILEACDRLLGGQDVQRLSQS